MKIIIEARDGVEDQVQVIVKESMEEAFGEIIPEVPFVAEEDCIPKLLKKHINKLGWG